MKLQKNGQNVWAAGQLRLVKGGRLLEMVVEEKQSSKKRRIRFQQGSQEVLKELESRRSEIQSWDGNDVLMQFDESETV